MHFFKTWRYALSAMPTPRDARTQLYRHYAADGTLLYVGIAFNSLIRLGMHKGSDWFWSIAYVTIETFASRKQAIAAEEAAVAAERPRYNKRKYSSEKPIEREIGLEVAIDVAGGIDELAKIVGLERLTVRTWRKVPEKHVPKIARRLNLRRYELRPDVYHARRGRPRRGGG
jgi:hypothetical protein